MHRTSKVGPSKSRSRSNSQKNATRPRSGAKIVWGEEHLNKNRRMYHANATPYEHRHSASTQAEIARKAKYAGLHSVLANNNAKRARLFEEEQEKKAAMRRGLTSRRSRSRSGNKTRKSGK
jgi:hypothetical protein